MYRSKTINPHVSLILPVYNESKRIQTGLKAAISYLEKQPYSWEIIVVDDGSTDVNTSGVALDSPEVKLIRTTRNFGKGHAIRVGVEASRGEYIIFSDIDFSVPPEFISPFLTVLKSTDIVIGSRRLRQSHVTQHQHFLRESLGHGFTQIANFILGLHHSDLTCGFKGFKRSVAQDLFRCQKLNRWAFDPEILFLAQKLHYRIHEFPVTWANDPHTKVNLINDLPQSLLSLLYIRLMHS